MNNRIKISALTALSTAAVALSATAAGATSPPSSVPTSIASGAPTSTLPATAPGAAGTGDLAARQAYAQTQLQNRVTFLQNLSAKVNNSTTLTATDKSTLQALIGSSSSGDISAMNNLESQVQSATTKQQVYVDIKSMIDGYRVYAIVGPQTALTLGQDKVSYVSGIVASMEPQLQTIVSSTGNSPASVAAMQQITSSISSIQSSLASVSQTIGQLTPAAFNANQSSVHGQILAAWSTIKADYASLRQVRADIKTISGL